jgi:hypothetical protein
MDSEMLGRVISTARKQKNLSQKELGDLLNVSNKTVSKWENGEATPRPETLIKLCDILELNKTEILGFEQKYDSKEIDSLKRENSKLKNQIESINKKQKKALKYIFVVAICFVIFVVAVSFLISKNSSQNSNIDDISQNGTKIVFADNEFIPIYKELEFTLNHEFDVSDCEQKYATYITKGGKKKKVLIYCDAYSDFVMLKAGGKNYYYANEKINYLKCDKKYIENIEIDTASIINNNFYEYNSLLFGDENYSGDKDLLIDYINSSKKNVSKKIVERYLGNKTRRVVICLKSNEDIGNINLSSFCPGEFFKDDKGKIYFYDYNTSNAYEVGKELGENVYK